MLKSFSGEVPSKWGPEIAVSGENAGRDPQKALPCASFDVFCVKIGARVSNVAFLKNQKVDESLCAEGREITHAQNRNP